MADLPPPSSGQFLEVSFRRLLNKCQRAVAGESSLGDAWPTSPLFHHVCSDPRAPTHHQPYQQYVETLQEQLVDLSSTRRVDDALLAAYRSHVQDLAAQLRTPDIPAYCLPVQQQSEALATLQTALDRQRSAQALLRQPRYLGHHRHHCNPMPPPPHSAQSSEVAPPGRASLSEATQARLATHGVLQDTLAGELVGLAQQLKQHAQGYEGALRARDRLVDDADVLVAGNMERTSRATAEATRVHRKNRVNFCTTCLVLLLVGVVFAGMYMFIKVTSFAGFSAARTRVKRAAWEAMQQQRRGRQVPTATAAGGEL